MTRRDLRGYRPGALGCARCREPRFREQSMQGLHEQTAEAPRRARGTMHLVVAVIVTVACSPPPASPVAPGATMSPEDAQHRVIAIGDRVLSDFLEVFPEVPVAIRPPGATFDGLPDDSIAA